MTNEDILQIALKLQKEEREKGCEYCNGNQRALSGFSYSYGVIIGNNISIHCGDDCYDDEFEIIYCPMCGRK